MKTSISTSQFNIYSYIFKKPHSHSSPPSLLGLPRFLSCWYVLEKCKWFYCTICMGNTSSRRQIYRYQNTGKHRLRRCHTGVDFAPCFTARHQHTTWIFRLLCSPSLPCSDTGKSLAGDSVPVQAETEGISGRPVMLFGSAPPPTHPKDLIPLPPAPR